MVPDSINCLMQSCLRLICLDFSLYILLYALPKVASLSQYTEMASIGYGHNSISNNIFLNHSASLSAAAKAINSDSMVE